jgi:hypothetical protein
MAATLSTEDSKQRTIQSPEQEFKSIPPIHAVRSSNQADQSLSSASTYRKLPLPDKLLLHLADFLYAIDVFNLSLTCRDVFRLFEDDYKSLREKLESRPHVTSKTDSTKKEGRKLPLWALLFLREKERVADIPAGRAYIRSLQTEYYEEHISACFEIVKNNDPDEKKREELKRTAPQVLSLFLEAAFQEYPIGSRGRLFIKDCIDKKIFRKVPWDNLLQIALDQIVESPANPSFTVVRIKCMACPDVKFLIAQGGNARIRTGLLNRLQMKSNLQDQTRQRSIVASKAQQTLGNDVRRLLPSTSR